MVANVESMFYVREVPWHGLGTRVNEAPASEDALRLAGLNWSVVQEPVYTEQKEQVEGWRANIRDSDRKVLGVVTDRYKVIQNRDAFAFTDALLGEGVRYETAGSLLGGRKVWLLAHMPHEYIIRGAYQPLPAVLQYPRRLRRSPGGFNAYPGGVQQYAEPCAVYSKPLLVHDSHRKYQGQAGRGKEYFISGRAVYGQPWERV